MIGIITHYDVHNHGASLQLFALEMVVKSMTGIESRALQFDKNYDFIDRSLVSKYKLSIRSVKPYLDFLRERGVASTLFNFRKHQTLGRFKSDHHLVGDYYTSYNKLDSVIIGSDEVFALHTGITPCFFGHALPSDRIISYAGCFGPTTLSDIARLHCTEMIQSGLKRMNHISARDHNSQKIMEDLTGQEVPIVLDPVLLYGFTDEIKSLERPMDEPYLLVYAYDKRMNTPDEVSAIKQYAKGNGLKIVSPGFYHSWVDKNVNVDPISLLSWFKHAEAVITDTFHGSIMSMINHRPFATYVRDNSNKLVDLLSSFGLTSQITKQYGNSLESILSLDIDYTGFENRLEEERELSLNWLKESLSR